MLVKTSKAGSSTDVNVTKMGRLIKKHIDPFLLHQDFAHKTVTGLAHKMLPNPLFYTAAGSHDLHSCSLICICCFQGGFSPMRE